MEWRRRKKKRGFGGGCNERIRWKLEGCVESVMGQRGRLLDGGKRGRRGGEGCFSPLLGFLSSFWFSSHRTEEKP